MFLLKLTIATGWSIEYVENLPESVISEYMALNSISPFTYEAQSHRDGLIASILYNKDLTKKKDLKSPDELIPYLKQGVPEWLQDSMVVKAKRLLESAKVSFSFSKDKEAYQQNIDLIKLKIKEEIEIEKNKKKSDKLRIAELNKLL